MATTKVTKPNAKQVAINDMMADMKTTSSKVFVKNNLTTLLSVSPQVFLTASLIGGL